MFLKEIIIEDFVNYKKPSLFLGFPTCSFKCGEEICQNHPLLKNKSIDIQIGSLIDKYYRNNYITQSIVLGGLEPLDSFKDVLLIIGYVRMFSKDDIVIYTGYNKEEVLDKITILKMHPNIVMKFGRYIPNQEKHFDEVLGVYLASDNQYAERIS